MSIRAAGTADLPRLTELAHAAKRSWGYPESWIASWKDELTFTETTLREMQVFVFETAGTIVGVFALKPGRAHWELEHVWVEPASMRKGVGSKLFEHARQVARAGGASRIRILSDPHAEPFYLRRGAVRIGEEASSIAGRRLPVLELPLSARPER